MSQPGYNVHSQYSPLDQRKMRKFMKVTLQAVTDYMNAYPYIAQWSRERNMVFHNYSVLLNF